MEKTGESLIDYQYSKAEGINLQILSFMLCMGCSRPFHVVYQSIGIQSSQVYLA